MTNFRKFYDKIHESININKKIEIRFNHNFQHNNEKIPHHKNDQKPLKLSIVVELFTQLKNGSKM